jgi:hypothetical protein
LGLDNTGNLIGIPGSDGIAVVVCVQPVLALFRPCDVSSPKKKNNSIEESIIYSKAEKQLS